MSCSNFDNWFSLSIYFIFVGGYFIFLFKLEHLPCAKHKYFFSNILFTIHYINYVSGSEVKCDFKQLGKSLENDATALEASDGLIDIVRVNWRCTYRYVCILRPTLNLSASLLDIMKKKKI